MLQKQFAISTKVFVRSLLLPCMLKSITLRVGVNDVIQLVIVNSHARHFAKLAFLNSLSVSMKYFV